MVVGYYLLDNRPSAKVINSQELTVKGNGILRFPRDQLHPLHTGGHFDPPEFPLLWNRSGDAKFGGGCVPHQLPREGVEGESNHLRDNDAEQFVCRVSNLRHRLP